MADPREAVTRQLAEAIVRADGWTDESPTLLGRMASEVRADRYAAVVFDVLPQLLAEHPEAFGLECEDGWVYVPDADGSRWDHRFHYEDEAPEDGEAVAALYRLPSREDTPNGDE